MAKANSSSSAAAGQRRNPPEGHAEAGEADETEELAQDAPAHQHEHDEHDAEDDEQHRPPHVLNAPAHRPGLGQPAIGGIERPPCRREGPRGAVDEEEEAGDPERAGAGSRRRLRGVEGRMQCRPQLARGAVLLRIASEIVGRVRTTHEPDDADGEQQHREQREHAVVGQRRRPVGHAVRHIALRRPNDGPGRCRAPGVQPPADPIHSARSPGGHITLDGRRPHLALGSGARRGTGARRSRACSRPRRRPGRA